MFAGIFYGGMYGGSTTSILLNTLVKAPRWSPPSRATRWPSRAVPPRPWPRRPSAPSWPALIGTMLLVLLAPYIVKVALEIEAADYFAIMLLAFIAVTAVLRASRIRGFASLAIGLTIGLVGIDQQTGQQRLTFGIPQARRRHRRGRGGRRDLRHRRGPVGGRPPPGVRPTSSRPGRRS